MKKIEKKVYTVEEVDELKKWFDNQILPQSMLNKFIRLFT